MKIPKNLHQFSHHNAIVMVFGNFGAEFYHIHDSSIEKVDTIKMNITEYLNIEGCHRHSTGGRTLPFGSGSVYRSKEKAIETDFLRLLKEKLSFTFKDKNIYMVYVLVPDYMKNIIKEVISPKIKGLGQRTIAGNYQKYHPLNLLRIIQENTAGEHLPPLKEEAQRILQKTDTARSVIGQKSEYLVRP